MANAQGDVVNTLVTGVAGFIGFHVARALLDRGEQVIGIDELNAYYDQRLKRDRVEELERYRGFIFHCRDIAVDDLTDLRFDRIIHLAAQAGVRYSLENPGAYAQSNLVGHLNILELARHNQCPMVYASSSSVYGNGQDTDHPVSLYAATKRSGELMSESYANLYRIPITCLRFFTVYGPWGRPDMAVWQFTQSIIEGRPISLFNRGDMVRDFTYTPR